MSELPNLRAVVFDLDGLIVNTEDFYLFARAEVVRRRGKSYDPAIREQMMGQPERVSLRILIDHHGLSATVDELVAESQQLLRRYLESSLELMPGVMPLLNELAAARFPLAIATSAARHYAALVLDRVQLADRFAFVLTTEDVERGKPAPDIYRLAAAKLQLPPARTMVLEDSGNGCQAGVAAGAFTVAVPNRHTRQHDFAGVHLIADTLADPRIRQALNLAAC